MKSRLRASLRSRTVDNNRRVTNGLADFEWRLVEMKSAGRRVVGKILVWRLNPSGLQESASGQWGDSGQQHHVPNQTKPRLEWATRRGWIGDAEGVSRD